MKIKLKLFLRKLVKSRPKESLSNTFERHRVNIMKKIYKNRFSKIDLKNKLISLGLEPGMDVFIHSSWRQFYNFEGSPEDVIEVIEDIIGFNGTILMPSYGADNLTFNVDTTPSHAGVITEVFRKQKKTLRSQSTHFSVSARGKNSEELLSNHIRSVYGFDENSPLYLLTKKNNSKLLFLGLSSEPTTISLFHCAGYLLKESIPFLNESIFTEKVITYLISENEVREKIMIKRNPQYRNDNKIFKKIFNSIENKKHLRLSNLDLVIVDAKEALDQALKHTENGEYCYTLKK